MYCFDIPDFLVNNELPVVMVGAGKAMVYFERYIRENYSFIYDKIVCYMDDRYESIKMSKDVFPIDKYHREALYLIVTIRPDSADSLSSKLNKVGVDSTSIKYVFPKYPLTEEIWNIIKKDTKLKIIECGARGGNSHMNRLRFFTGEENVVTIGFDPDEEECNKLNKSLANYKAYPYIVDDVSGKKRIMYQILQNGCVTFYKPNVEVVSRFEVTEECDPIKIFREIESLNTIKLDDWMIQTGEDIDYLMINVDSAEYHVIKGAMEMLKKNICCLEVETNFGFFFDESPSFTAVDGLIRETGCFELLDLHTPFILHSAVSPFKFEPRKLICYNAFYCKHIFNILQNSKDGLVKLLKTVSILEILDYQEIAFDMIIRAYHLFVKNQDFKNSAELSSIITKAFNGYSCYLTPTKKLDDILSTK